MLSRALALLLALIVQSPFAAARRFAAVRSDSRELLPALVNLLLNAIRFAWLRLYSGSSTSLNIGCAEPTGGRQPPVSIDPSGCHIEEACAVDPLCVYLHYLPLYKMGDMYSYRSTEDDPMSASGSDVSDMETQSDYFDSDVEKAPSVYSYSSSRDAHMLRNVHGRYLNNQNQLYALPADAEEQERIDTQHTMLKLALGSLYPAEHLVKRALQPDGRTRKALLDVGTGAGTWAIEVAQQFPHVQIVGIDLAHVFRRDAPPNCKFEVDDVNLGMSHYSHAFNVVHCRSIGNGIPDYPAFIDDILDTIRPGGVLILGEGDFQLRTAEKERAHPNSSACSRFLFEVYNTMKAKGTSVDAGCLFERWLRNQPKCRNVQYRQVYTPVGPWLPGRDANTQRQNQIGELLRRDFRYFLHGVRPLMLEEGYIAASLDRMIADAERELAALTTRYYIVWHFAWAEKVG